MSKTNRTAETNRQNAIILRTIRSALARAEQALAEMQTAETDDGVRAETEEMITKYRRMIAEIE